jgi:hypothetical protein
MAVARERDHPDMDSVSRCQTGNVAVGGYFYVAAYDADVLRVIPRPIDGLAAIVRCSAIDHNVTEDGLGYVVFSPGGAKDGCNPCLEPCAPATPVTPTTWGGIKTLLGR